MAIIKFTNAYATLEEIEPIMTGFCEYASKTSLEKENLIINISKLIDIDLKYEGEKIDPLQPMQFPREFEYVTQFFSEQELFLQDEQERRLIKAVYFQLAFVLDQVPAGVVNYTVETERKQRFAGLNNNAKQVLDIYTYKGEISDSNVWY